MELVLVMMLTVATSLVDVTPQVVMVLMVLMLQMMAEWRRIGTQGGALVEISVEEIFLMMVVTMAVVVAVVAVGCHGEWLMFCG